MTDKFSLNMIDKFTVEIYRPKPRCKTPATLTNKSLACV